MTRADPQLKLRLPEQLKDQVEVAARAAGRSMNAEIVARLEASFSPEVKFSRVPDSVVEQLSEKIAEHLVVDQVFLARVQALAQTVKKAK